MEVPHQIPKIIHYCWFGKTSLPEDAQRCIASWKKFCPDYEIVEWNETKINLSALPLYVQQAYAAQKYAVFESGRNVEHDHECISPDRYLSRTGDAPEWSMSVCCRTYDLPCGLLLPFGIGYRPFKTDRKHGRHSLVRRKLVEQRGKIRMENHPSPASHPSCKNGQTAGQSDRNCTISRMEFSCRNFFRFLQKAEEA